MPVLHVIMYIPLILYSLTKILSKRALFTAVIVTFTRIQSTYEYLSQCDEIVETLCLKTEFSGIILDTIAKHFYFKGILLYPRNIYKYNCTKENINIFYLKRCIIAYSPSETLFLNPVYIVPSKFGFCSVLCGGKIYY